MATQRVSVAWGDSSGEWDATDFGGDNDLPLGAEAAELENFADALATGENFATLAQDAQQSAFTLRFSRSLEDEYTSFITDRLLRAVRVAVLCATVLFVVFFASMRMGMLGETDALKERYKKTSYYQAAAAGIAFLLFLFMFTKLFRRLFFVLSLVAYVTIFLLVVIALFLPRGLAGDGHFSSASILSAISVVLVMGQFAKASLYIVFCVVGMILQISISSEDSNAHVATILFPGVIACLYPLLSIYLTDRQMRRVWLSKRAFNLRHTSLGEEKEQMERLLRLQLPGPILDQMRHPERAESLSKSCPSACVVFVELAGWAEASAHLAPADAVAVLNLIFTRFDTLCERYGLEKIKTIGPIFMAASGLVKTDGHVTEAARFAMRMMREWRDWKSRSFAGAGPSFERSVSHGSGDDVLNTSATAGGLGHARTVSNASSDLGMSVPSNRVQINAILNDVSLKIGMHTGEVVAGIVGDLKFCYDIYGDTVNTASRVCKFGSPNHVRCTADVRDALNPADFQITSMGQSEFKGKGLMETFDIAPVRRRRSEASTSDGKRGHRRSELASSIGRLLRTRGIRPQLGSSDMAEGDSDGAATPTSGDENATEKEARKGDADVDATAANEESKSGESSPRRKRSSSVGTAEEAMAASLRRSSVRPIVLKFAALTEPLHGSAGSLFGSDMSLASGDSGDATPHAHDAHGARGVHAHAHAAADNKKALYHHMSTARRHAEAIEGSGHSAPSLPGVPMDEIGTVTVQVDSDVDGVVRPAAPPAPRAYGSLDVPTALKSLSTSAVTGLGDANARFFGSSKSSLGPAPLATLTAAALSASSNFAIGSAVMPARSATTMSQSNGLGAAVGSAGSDSHSRRSSRSISLSVQVPPADAPAVSRADALTRALQENAGDLETRMATRGRLNRFTLTYADPEVEDRFRTLLATRRGNETSFHMVVSIVLMLTMAMPDIVSDVSVTLKFVLVGVRWGLGTLVCLLPAYVISRSEGFTMIGRTSTRDDMRSMASSSARGGRYTLAQRVRRVSIATLSFLLSYVTIMVGLSLVNRPLNEGAFCHLVAVVLYTLCVITSSPSFIFSHLLWVFGALVVVMFGAKAFGLTPAVGISTVVLGLVGVLITAATRYRYERFVREQLIVDLVAAEQERELVKEKGMSEELLHNILPPSIAKQLASNPDCDTAMHLTEASAALCVRRFIVWRVCDVRLTLNELVCVFAMDIISFTSRASTMTAEEVVALLNSLFNMLDSLVRQVGAVEKICTIGDAYIAASGVPEPFVDHAERVCLFGMDVIKAIAGYNLIRASLSKFEPVRVRAGIHSGACVAGVMGGKVRVKFDLYGDAMDTAVRLEQTGSPLALHISHETIKRLATTDIFAENAFVLEAGEPLESGLNTYLAKSALSLSASSLESDGIVPPPSAFRSSLSAPAMPSVTEALSFEHLASL